MLEVLRRADDPPPDALRELAPTASPLEPRDERPICCAVCRAKLTTQADAMEVHGAHLHHRVNPSGTDYRVRCFRTAPGVRAAGPPMRFFTWFPGYAWEVAFCAACNAHVGWWFSGEAGSFAGLIAARLVED